MGYSTQPLRGVIAPVFTPFNDDLSIATDLYTAHALSLMKTGCGALAPFAATGEAFSINRADRVNALWALKEAGIDPAKMIPGAGSCSSDETADLARACLDLGCAGVMIPPPFFYKQVQAQGLFDWYTRVIEAVGDDLRLYLHNSPQISDVHLRVPLVRKLRDTFPDQVVGIIDNSDDWDHTKALFGINGLIVYPSSETRILEGMALGAPGCITATANFNAPAMVEMLAAHKARNTEDAALLRKTISGIRDAAAQVGFISVPKAYIALKTGDPRWANVRPPLVRASDAEAREFQRKIDAAQ